MEDPRHRVIVIVLTATALALVAFSLVSPWFSATTTSTYLPPGTQYSKAHWLLYTDCYTVEVLLSDAPTPHDTYNHAIALVSLMSLEKGIMLASFILGLAFLGLTIANRRRLSIAVGLITVNAMALGVAVFAMTVAGALDTAYSEGFGGGTWFPHLRNFFGSMIYADGRVSISWGPASGWFLALGACAIVAVALLIEAPRVLSDRREEPGSAKGEEDGNSVSEIPR